MIGAFFTYTVEIVKDTKSLLCFKLNALTSELAQVSNHIVTYTVKIGAGFLYVFLQTDTVIYLSCTIEFAPVALSSSILLYSSR